MSSNMKQKERTFLVSNKKIFFIPRELRDVIVINENDLITSYD